jgi:hypothetical protein
VNEKAFQRELPEPTVDLYRSIIESRLGQEEAIHAEHHVIRSHMKIAQSVLKEPDQEAISLFATEKHLIRLRSTLKADRPPTPDGEDDASVDAVPYGRIDSLKPRRQIRLGELAAGAGMLCAGLVFSSWLSITGPFMVGLGALGMVHALLLPTRWIEVSVIGPDLTSGPILIYALRKKSARRLMKYIREKARRAL